MARGGPAQPRLGLHLRRAVDGRPASPSCSPTTSGSPNWPVIITIIGWLGTDQRRRAHPLPGQDRGASAARSIQAPVRLHDRRRHLARRRRGPLLLRLFSPLTIRTRKREQSAMNNHDLRLRLETPKVTTGPAARLAQGLRQARDRAGPARAHARDRLTKASGEPPLPVYDTTGPYTDPDVAIDVEKGLKRAPHRLGERARRRRGIRRPRRSRPRTTATSPASTPRASIRPSTGRCAGSTATRSRSSNSPATASSPRR